MKSWRHKVLFGAVATACAIPVGAADFSFELEEAKARDEEAWSELTEVRSTVELGFGYVSDDSFKHGEYSGLHKDGLFPVLNFDIYKRDAYDSETARYWKARGTGLGLDSRSLSLEHGDQGDYKVGLEYDQLPRMQFDSTETIFRGAGGNRLQLPADGSRTTLTDSLRPFDVDTERQRIGVKVEKILFPRWSVRGSVSHETKEGSKVTGIAQNPAFFSPSVLVPEPIDYETNQFRGSLAYTGDKGQAELGYQLSLFENRNRFFTWQDPYADDWSTAEERQWVPAPDNEFHQVRLTGGYNLQPRTRAYADLSVGRMIQDERFIDTGIPMSRTTAGGLIDTRVANVGISARPLPRLNLNASYRYDERDNRTPQVLVVDRLTTPYSYKENRIRWAADYRLLTRTNLAVSYQRNDVDRTFVARENAEEGVIETRLKTTLNSMFAGGVVLAREERRGSTYVGAGQLQPQLRQFWLADRDRDRYGVFANVAPLDSLTLGANVNRVRDEYNASELGLTDGEATIYNLDGSYVPFEGLTTYAFYSYEDNESNQAGPAWTAQLIDRVGTVGVGLSKSLLGDRLKLGTDLVYAKGVGRIRVASALGQQPLPPLLTRLRQLNVFADYKLRKNLTLGLRYRLERYDSTDWAVDGVAPNTSANLITMGGESPDYKVHVIAVSAAYRF